MTREEFLHDANNNDLNHRILLWEAMELTNGSVIELGSGHGSTPYLRDYCRHNKRSFRSYDNNKEWSDVTGATLITDWSALNIKEVDVLFIDHAPGEDRQYRIKEYAYIAKILVIHDSEPAQDHGYQTRQHYPSFRYWVEIQTNGAWCTMVSNFIDLSSTIGKGNDIYPYKIVNGK